MTPDVGSRPSSRSGPRTSRRTASASCSTSGESATRPTATGSYRSARETAELLADALEQDIVQEYGWIFPEGRLDYDDARDKPWSRDAAIDRLADAEHASGIEHVAGRAYHGIKRIHVTKSMEIAHGDTQLVGDLTGNVSAALLRQTYRFGQGASKARHVDAIREALNEPKTDGNRA